MTSESYIKGIVFADVESLGSVYDGCKVRVTCLADAIGEGWYKGYFSDGSFTWFKYSELVFD